MWTIAGFNFLKGTKSHLSLVDLKQNCTLRKAPWRQSVNLPPSWKQPGAEASLRKCHLGRWVWLTDSLSPLSFSKSYLFQVSKLCFTLFQICITQNEEGNVIKRRSWTNIRCLKQIATCRVVCRLILNFSMNLHMKTLLQEKAEEI